MLFVLKGLKGYFIISFSIILIHVALSSPSFVNFVLRWCLFLFFNCIFYIVLEVKFNLILHLRTICSTNFYWFFVASLRIRVIITFSSMKSSMYSICLTVLFPSSCFLTGNLNDSSLQTITATKNWIKLQFNAAWEMVLGDTQNSLNHINEPPKSPYRFQVHPTRFTPLW